MAAPWGATRADWARAKKLAKPDALPVVSDPDAPISIRSNMRRTGKTPSVFNRDGHVIGFPKWTEHRASVPDYQEWMAEPAYGICIQTRDVRALDIDVPDKVEAKKIRLRFLELVGLTECPRRWREGSGKELLAFRVEGTGEELTKRSFIVKEWEDLTTGKKDHWIVEFLAHGQQFVAAGTHTERMRYQWDDGGIPEEVPVITLEVFLAAWATLAEEFKLEGTVERHRDVRAPTLTEDIDVDDPVIEHLITSGYPTYDYERGKLYVECPWSDTHGNDNGPTQTAWMPAGTRGYRNGHFSCLHTGCDCHTDADFLKAVGYRPAKAEEFEDLTEEGALEDAKAAKRREVAVRQKSTLGPSAKANIDRMPGFIRHEKTLQILTTLNNVLRGVRAPAAVGVELIHDRLRDELMLAEQAGAWRRFVDADAVRLRITLEALDFKSPIGRELMRDALLVLADEQQFDSAEEWVMKSELEPGGVPAWDGVKRIERFYPDCLNTEDNDYTQALGRYSWSAQAGRVIEPGCQVDMVPVLVSPEGFAKTSVIRAIAPSPEFFSEFSFEMDEKERTRLMIGCLVGELSELRGIGARDGEAIKSWITRRKEEWVPKFVERKTAYLRRLVLYGTTNDESFLKPHMGERRWLPVRIQRPIDVRKIERDRLQLWAEGRDYFLADGIAWQDVQRLAEAERSQFKDEDVWLVKISRWVHEVLDGDGALTPFNCGTLRIEQVAWECLGIDPSRLTRKDEMRIAEVLRGLGMVGTQKRVSGIKARYWEGKT